MADNGQAQGSGQSSNPNRKAYMQNHDINNSQWQFETPKKTPGRKEQPSPSEISSFMTDHGLIYEDFEAFEKHGDFVAKVKAIVLGDRWSTMKPESLKRFRNYHTYYRSQNEDAFLHNVFPLMMRNGYYKLENAQDYHAPGMAEDRRTYADFLEDEGIANVINCEFQEAIVPSRFKGDSQRFTQQISKALEKTTGMTNPRPDYVFGHTHDKMPPFRVDLP